MIRNRVVYILITLLVIFYPKVCLASTIDEQRQALLETAMAFYYKGGNVQYDSYRQMALATPEDAAPNHVVYTDCSTFTYQVYEQALGIETSTNTYYLADYATKNSQDSSVVFNMVAPSNGNTYNNANILNEIRNWLNNNKSFDWQTGDLLVIRRFDDTGHVMMIDASDSNIKIIESGYDATGGWYDARNYQDKLEKQSISISSLTERLSKMLNYQDNNQIKQISVLRFTSNGSSYLNFEGKRVNYDITNAAYTRLSYPGLNITKNITIINSSNSNLSEDYATPGSILLYQITVKNESNRDYSNITVTEKKDSKVSFKDKGNGTINGNNITFNIPNLKSKTSYTVYYSVLVSSNKSALGSIITSRGNVGGIETRVIRTHILNSLNNSQITTFKNTYNNLKYDSAKDMTFISKIYNQAFGVDLSFLNNLDIYDFLNISNCTENSICGAQVSNNSLKNILVSNFYGLRIIPYGYNNTYGINILSDNLIYGNLAWDVFSDEMNSRAREISLNDLQVGDIILLKDSISKSNNTKAYLYIGSKELIRNTGGYIESIVSDNLIKFLKNLVGENYVILRPAIMMDNTYIEMVEQANVVPNVNQNVPKSSLAYNSTTSNKNKYVPTIVTITVAEGTELTNPDCGSSLPFILISILFGLFLVIRIIKKPKKLYKID